MPACKMEVKPNIMMMRRRKKITVVIKYFSDFPRTNVLIPNLQANSDSERLRTRQGPNLIKRSLQESLIEPNNKAVYTYLFQFV